MIDILNLKLGIKEKKYVHDGFGGSNESDSGEIVYSDMDLTLKILIIDLTTPKIMLQIF